MERLDARFAADPSMKSTMKTLANATNLYTRLRQEPSRRSLRRSKELVFPATLHPLFADTKQSPATDVEAHLKAIHKFRPRQTIFEVEGMKKGKVVGEATQIMQ